MASCAFTQTSIRVTGSSGAGTTASVPQTLQHSCLNYGSALEHDAVEQGDEADEAALERERGMVDGSHRGWAAIVGVRACSGASQLIRGVGRTLGRESGS
jgi:hypothetical protein